MEIKYHLDESVANAIANGLEHRFLLCLHFIATSVLSPWLAAFSSSSPAGVAEAFMSPDPFSGPDPFSSPW